MKTLIIDNYDSFTWNLYQYIGELEGNPVVYKNDAITAEKVTRLAPSHIIISPGPGTVTNRNDFGVCQEIIGRAGPTVPLLGVCLGHQGIAAAFGGQIERAPVIMHGKQSLIEHAGMGILSGIENPFKAMRYHSLRVSEKNFPEVLRVTARVQHEGTIMALQHSRYPIFGIQFHPESFGTPAGKQILNNFLNY